MSKIFSFDLGSGSIGECVREDDKILHLDAFLIDNEFASLTEVRKLRRAFRTRLAHKARENWWRFCAEKGNLEILSTEQPNTKKTDAKPDKRILTEFSPKGDDTVYTSCLLRILLLQGQKLESWQVYKAVWSALQHRGYDAQVPWASDIKVINDKIKQKEELTDKEKDLLKNIEEESKASKLYEEKISVLPKEYQFPCFFEAYTLGLWNPENPTCLKKQINFYTKNIRNKDGKEQIVIPRSFIEKELRQLLDNARKQYPSLPETDFILYGTPKTKYSSYNNPQNKKYESEGILGQKIPRFDNRIISKCCCIPRLNVCNACDKLNIEVFFLLSLLNMRFTYGNAITAQLLPEQLKQIFDDYKKNLSTNKNDNTLVIKQADWKREITNYGGKVKENQKSVSHPKTTGRSSFSRPALKILKDLILSGKKPHDFYEEQTAKLTNTDPMKGLVKEDFSFLKLMPNEWGKIHIPDHRYINKQLSFEEAQDKIEEIIKNISNAVVKHRLTMFYRRLSALKQQYGTPDKVILELAREDFMGEEKKAKYIKAQNDKRKEKDSAKDELEQYYSFSNSKEYQKLLLKARLLREQNYQDVYELGENNKIAIEELDAYDIDHIVPVSRGGSDSMANKVLTKREINQTKKKDKIPYEMYYKDASEETWQKYLKHLKDVYGNNISKYLDTKYELLTSDKAEEIERKRNDLQATMYIEKYARQITALFFCWGDQTKGDNRRVFVCNGALTAKLRKENGLDRLLYTEEDFSKYLESGKLEEKNRENKKHHALDALVISFAADLRTDPKSGRKLFPEFAQSHPNFFDRALSKVYPKQLRKKTPALRETIYALRCRKENGEDKYYMVSRFNTELKSIFGELKDAKKQIEKIFDYQIQNDLRAKLDTKPTKDEWLNFLENYKLLGKTPVYKVTMIASKPFSKKDVFDENGKKRQVIGEYKEMGKMKGQYLMPKESNKGQIIYRQNNKWKVEPVYPFDSVSGKLTECKQRYGKVMFWSSGDILMLQNDISGSEVYTEEHEELVEYKDRKGETKTRKKINKRLKNKKAILPKGKYKLNTLGCDGKVKLTNLSLGIKYSTSLNKLIEEGKVYKEK